jgi:hypothetical protein
MFMRGFGPARRDTFVSAKVPKTMLCACAERRGTGPPPRIRMAQKLAPRCKATSPLRQSSPEKSIRGGGPAAPNAGEMPGTKKYNLCLSKERKRNDEAGTLALSAFYLDLALMSFGDPFTNG